MSKKILIVDDEPNIVLSLDYLVRKKDTPRLLHEMVARH